MREQPVFEIPYPDRKYFQWEGGVRDGLLAYGFANIKKEHFLPCVGYMKDGKIVDTMFDAIYFSMCNQFMYAGFENWEKYINDQYNIPDAGMNALNQAVGEVKEALGIPDYKVKVFLTAFPPSKQDKIVEGHGMRLDLSNLEDRKTATKWQADEQIRIFYERGYEHLELRGFHWPVESAAVTDPDMTYVGWFFTDYIRSLGLKTSWGPYFLAAGHNSHKALGFDLGMMQPNYFMGNALNGGGVERLRASAQIAKECDMGISPELQTYLPEAFRIFKDYLYYGVKLGYIDAYHVWYMSSGPVIVEQLCNDKDPYARSVYDDSYKFIKRTLDPDAMILDCDEL